MSDNPEVIIACVPVALAAIHAPDYLRIAWRDDGSSFTQVACPSCGEMMWLGVRRQAPMVAAGARMMCSVCLVRMADPTASLLEAQRKVGRALAEKIQVKK